MSYDDDHPYSNRSYPGRRAPPPDLTDQAQHAGLGPLDGDTEITHDTLNHPWGKVVKLSLTAGVGVSLRSAGLVATEAFPRPFPWAIQARFSTDGVTFTPTIPATWTGQIRFDFVKSFDVKTGVAKESFILDPGDGLPLCALIARALTVTATLLGEGALDIWVQFVVCPTTAIECGELSPSSPVPTFGITTPNIVTRFPAVAAVDYEIPAEPTRAVITFANMSAVDLFVCLAVGANATVGDELATIVLPANAVAGYEIAGYVGVVTFKFAADDSPGYVLVTRGFY